VVDWGHWLLLSLGGALAHHKPRLCLELRSVLLLRMNSSWDVAELGLVQNLRQQLWVRGLQVLN